MTARLSSGEHATDCGSCWQGCKRPHQPRCSPAEQRQNGGVRLAPQRMALRGRQGLCRLRLGMDVIADVVTRRTTVAVFLLNKLRLSN